MPFQLTRRRAALASAALLCLAGCDDDDDDNSAPPGVPTGAPITVYVSHVDVSGDGEVVRMDRNFAPRARYFTGNQQGVDLDYLGNLYQAGDGANGPSVRIFSLVNQRLDLEPFEGLDIDREIAGNDTELVAPKGIHLSHTAGLLLVADFGASAIHVFGTAAGGDVAPLASSILPAAPWDLFHDEAADRLFVALTDGTVGVIDNYALSGFPATFTRRIAPADGTATRISENLHGIVYDVAGDRLVVSDVGDPAVDTDGSLYIIDSASTADGLVVPSRVIEGSSTGLGNPVDIALDGARLRVAEKANGGGTLLVFNDIFSGTGTNVAPAFQSAFGSPESLTLEPDMPIYEGEASDLDGAQVALAQVLTTRNDPANTAAEDLLRHDPLTLARLSAFETSFGVESLDLDVLGNAYVTVDDGGNGAILVLNRAAVARDDESADASRDRVIHTVGLVAPKGIEVVEQRGLVLVAETVGTSSAGILGYSTQAYGFGTGVAPVLQIDLGIVPWDLDYDASRDRLFVAMTDGTVAVFDDLLDGQVTPSAPDRTFSIADPAVPAAQLSTNLHGIVYDASTDRLIVSDVNDPSGASFDTDGRIFVIDGASTASGLVLPRVYLEGPSTLLGNPVDIAFDGADLYVAEKANAGGQVLFFPAIADVDTSLSTDIAPLVTAPMPDVESIALARSGLAPNRGGSIDED